MNQTQKTVAIIGASNNHSKYGNIAVRAYKEQGFTVYPVNIKEEMIEGLQSYSSILDVPDEKIELVSVYLPPEKTLNVLEEIKQKEPEMVFLNPGSESGEVLTKAEELGLNAIQACSVMALGKTPDEYS